MTTVTLLNACCVLLAVFGAFVGHRLALRATATERQRIARTLHDGCVQTLAALNLQLESCCELLRRGQTADVVAALRDLQAIVNQEHDELRSYARSLAHRPPTSMQVGSEATRLAVHADFSGSAALVEEVLQIMREGVTNVRRHAHAQSAAIRVHARGSAVYVTIDDDGIGLRAGTAQPWSIASRVRDLGGLVEVARNSHPGGHLTIALPAALP